MTRAYADTNLSALSIDYHSRDVTIERTTGDWGDDGLFQLSQPYFVPIYALVQPFRPGKHSHLLPEGMHIEGAQVLHSRDRVYSADDDSKYNDILLWDNKRWAVRTIANVAEGGFYRSICTLADHTKIEPHQEIECEH